MRTHAGRIVIRGPPKASIAARAGARRARRLSPLQGQPPEAGPTLFERFDCAQWINGNSMA